MCIRMTTFFSIGRRLWLGAGLVAVAGLASAADETTTFTVSATVAESCTVSAANLSFGTYDRTLGNTATAIITANCTLGTTYSLALDFGGAVDANSRVMDDGGGSELSYQLYQNALRTTVWGTGGDAKTGLTGTGLDDVTNIVYGSVPSGQNKAAGSYTDTVTVTLTY